MHLLRPLLTCLILGSLLPGGLLADGKGPLGVTYTYQT